MWKHLNPSAVCFLMRYETFMGLLFSFVKLKIYLIIIAVTMPATGVAPKEQQEAQRGSRELETGHEGNDKFACLCCKLWRIAWQCLRHEMNGNGKLVWLKCLSSSVLQGQGLKFAVMVGVHFLSLVYHFLLCSLFCEMSFILCQCGMLAVLWYETDFYRFVLKHVLIASFSHRHLFYFY